ncbi:HMG box domain-containing protein [Mycena chlorophos]|uniref:HMG box domain-containing protein n=1 Tax=Mycena chlorophos TaxID=658473 RepID=A0A8H6SB74_MYCCL|nr:HMG box domain-containing protein [Mycena chlorophos]
MYAHPSPLLLDVNPAPSDGTFAAEPHIPRPRNAFICFRSWFYQTERLAASTSQLALGKQSSLSTRAGLAWKALTPEQRVPFQLEAEEEKRVHSERYPGYKYRPAAKPKAKRARRALSDGASDCLTPNPSSLGSTPERPVQHFEHQDAFFEPYFSSSIDFLQHELLDSDIDLEMGLNMGDVILAGNYGSLGDHRGQVVQWSEAEADIEPMHWQDNLNRLCLSWGSSIGPVPHTEVESPFIVEPDPAASTADDAESELRRILSGDMSVFCCVSGSVE